MNLMQWFTWFLLLVALIREHNESINRTNLRRRFLRDTSDPYNMAETTFIRTFRLPRTFAFDMIQGLANYLPGRERWTGIDLHIRALATIRFLFTGEYQLSIGESNNHCMGASTVGEAIRDVSIAIEEAYFRRWIRFHIDGDNAECVRLGFLQTCGLDNIYGAIDGFHVEFTALSYSNLHEPAFVNRHNTHSLNVLMVTDTFFRILYICARFPGSNHDSFNFRMSNLRDLFVNLWNNGRRNIRLLGDSGFPLEPWLLRPFEGRPARGTPRSEFNRRLKRGRVVVEQTIGVLRNIGRGLNGDRRLHYQPDVAGRFVNCAAILYNMGIFTRVHQPTLEDIPDNPDDSEDENDNDSDNDTDEELMDVEEENMEGQFDAVVNFVQEGIRVRENYLESL